MKVFGWILVNVLKYKHVFMPYLQRLILTGINKMRWHHGCTILSSSSFKYWRGEFLFYMKTVLVVLTGDYFFRELKNILISNNNNPGLPEKKEGKQKFVVRILIFLLIEKEKW